MARTNELHAVASEELCNRLQEFANERNITRAGALKLIVSERLNNL